MNLRESVLNRSSSYCPFAIGLQLTDSLRFGSFQVSDLVGLCELDLQCNSACSPDLPSSRIIRCQWCIKIGLALIRTCDFHSSATVVYVVRTMSVSLSCFESCSLC